MIGYIKGKIIYKQENMVLLLVNGLGYEIIIPTIIMRSLSNVSENDAISFYIYHHQTERQPKPVLIGFNSKTEKDFFKEFISTNAIGPMKAVKALSIPINKIAAAIDTGDTDTLKKLNGIGIKTAQKILLSLQGKMGSFTSNLRGEAKLQTNEIITKAVMDVLVMQLGYKTLDAKKMIEEALEKKGSIDTAEKLFDEIYMGTK